MEPDHIALLTAMIDLSGVEAVAREMRVERSTVHRWRHGERSIPGPAQVLIEQMAVRDGVAPKSKKSRKSPG